ncbi:SGNH/GDSL hydrolase family protein [Tundrisphaera sp. TA3]|uniref:SGNH/GDSL hydrolase family protein n=1 Tax=Tundrisphaera sp. TA3 TaxID=3435775 RepID=UPI003EBD7C52
MQFRRALAVVLLVLGSPAASQTQAGFTGIVAFGDSLTDTGNVYAQTGFTYPTPPYAGGRFSNGPLWVETLALGLGLEAPRPVSLGGTNYAFANAETGAEPGPGGSVSGVPNLDTQVGLYLLSGPQDAASKLFVVWAGANDLLHQAAPNPARSVGNILSQITALSQAGAKEFVVPNLPQLGYTPAVAAFGPAAAAQFNLLTQDFNMRLAAGLGGLASGLGIRIHQLDVDGVFQQILANPSRFQISNITAAAKSGETGLPGTVDRDADHFLFWDGVHPTARVHDLIGQGALAPFAVPEPSSCLLVGLGIAACSVAARRRR